LIGVRYDLADRLFGGSGLVPAPLAQDATDEQTTYGPEQRDDDDNFVHC